MSISYKQFNKICIKSRTGCKKPMLLLRSIGCGLCSTWAILKNSQFVKYTVRLRKKDIKVSQIVLFLKIIIPIKIEQFL